MLVTFKFSSRNKRKIGQPLRFVSMQTNEANYILKKSYQAGSSRLILLAMKGVDVYGCLCCRYANYAKASEGCPVKKLLDCRWGKHGHT
jgi:hypothetical protein